MHTRAKDLPCDAAPTRSDARPAKPVKIGSRALRTMRAPVHAVAPRHQAPRAGAQAQKQPRAHVPAWRPSVARLSIARASVAGASAALVAEERDAAARPQPTGADSPVPRALPERVSHARERAKLHALVAAVPSELVVLAQPGL